MIGISREVVRAVACTAVLAATSLTSNAATLASPSTVSWHGYSGHAEFHVIDGQAVIILRSADGKVVPLRAITSITDAVAVLADRRLVSMRAPLLAWAGSDLVPLRDRTVNRAREAEEAGIVSMMPHGTSERWTGDLALTAALQYGKALVRAGRFEDAVVYLKAKLAGTPPGKDASFPYVFLTIRLASTLFEWGHEDEAVDLLKREAADQSIAADARLNLKVNLAQFLARTGRNEEALQIVDVAWSSFGDQPKDGETVKVPDSEAAFAWIKACALAGLGRHDEARLLMESIEPKPSDDIEISPTLEAGRNYAVCRRDPAELATQLALILSDAPPAGDVFADLQPQATANAKDRAVMERALDQPVLAKAIGTHAVDLAAGFAPVTGPWQPFAIATRRVKP